MSGAKLRKPPRNEKIRPRTKLQVLESKLASLSRRVEALTPEAIDHIKAYNESLSTQVALVHEIYLQGRHDLMGKALEATWLPPEWWNENKI